MQGAGFADLMERMLRRVGEDVDKSEGSLIYSALAPAAAELAQMYIELGDVLDEGFADTASREFLLRRAAERGLAPYPAEAAALRGEFVPAGCEVLGQRFTLGALAYRAVERLAPGVYRMECEEAGSAGHAQLGAMLPAEYIEGLESAEATAVLAYGREEEETEAFRGRYLASFSPQSFGGNRRDYLDKCRAIAGVGAVKVTPLWNGVGSVKLTVLGEGCRRAEEALVALVQREIDPGQDGMGAGLAPIGHVVTVDTASEVGVRVTARLVLEGRTAAQVQAALHAALEGYFDELRRGWAESERLTLRLAQIETRLLGVEGVVDLGATLLNGAGENLVLGACELPVLEAVDAVEVSG